MGKRSRTRKASDRVATLCSLPHDIMGKIIRELDFEDKCSLDLVSKDFNALLSNPLSAEGLWGICDLKSDLKLEDHWDSKEDIMRWLTRRLPGFLHLICDAPFDGDQSERYNATEAASWLVAQLPKLCSASMAKFELHLKLGPDEASKLLRLITSQQSIQDDFWSALSERLTGLAVIMDPAQQPIRMDVLSQLTKLTSLTICMKPDMKDSNGNYIDEAEASYTLDLPGVQSLHMASIEAKNLVLLCPKLRSLTMDYPYIAGKLSLPASLGHLSMRGISGPPAHEPYQVSDLLGLTSLLCHASGPMDQDLLYATLPSMAVLKALVLISFNGKLPSSLPASLQRIRYILQTDDKVTDLQHVAAACQLPEMRSVSLYNCQAWKLSELRALQKIRRESKVDVIVKEDWVDEDGTMMGRTLR